MIDRGEAYMHMEKKAETKPQKSLRGWPRRASREMAATKPKTASARARSPAMRAFVFFGANTRKITT